MTQRVGLHLGSIETSYIQHKILSQLRFLTLKRLKNRFSSQKYQCIFPHPKSFKGKYSRTISVNSAYLILLDNPRDYNQIYCLARQVYPLNSKFLIEAYQDAVKVKHGYLLLDFKPGSIYCVQSGILDNDHLKLNDPKKSINWKANYKYV